MRSTFCVAEDREAHEPSLRLLLLSLAKLYPEATISLFSPIASPGFLAWTSCLPQVRRQGACLDRGIGWNVKPQAIMRLIEQGFDEVIWVDSDVLCVRRAEWVGSGLGRETVVACEHENAPAKVRRDDGGLRARLWGFPVGRVLPVALNSCVLRFTASHRLLLERWWDLVRSEEYRGAQRVGWARAPVHMKGDQDVLTALLASVEFSGTPVRVLRRGRDIVQFDGVYGYTVPERAMDLLGGGAAFIHCFGAKPWTHGWGQHGGLRDYVKEVYLDVSPYTLWAMRFRAEFASESPWMEPHHALSGALRALGMGHPSLVGLPMAFLLDLLRPISSRFGRTRPVWEVARSEPQESTTRTLHAK